jgi:hypothetical protein
MEKLSNLEKYFYHFNTVKQKTLHYKIIINLLSQ